MTKARIVQDGIKTSEPLERVFHMLFTKTMYTELENQSVKLTISKGALIRYALQDYFKKLDTDKPVEHQDLQPLKHQENINTNDTHKTKEPVVCPQSSSVCPNHC